MFIRFIITLILGLLQTELVNLYSTEKITYSLNKEGYISNLLFSDEQGSDNIINFRKDKFSGPSLWLGGSKLPITSIIDSKGVTGNNDSISYKIIYEISESSFVIKVSCKNLLSVPLNNIRLSLLLGIDTEMISYPQWHNIYFPTLIRCEKTHFWGYFMTPKGRILTISSPNSISSYHLLYNNSSEKISFGNGHRIRSISLDLLNPEPLPERHPHGLSIEPGKERSWTIFLKEADNLCDIPEIVSSNCKAPVLQADYYTLPPDKQVTVSVYSDNLKELVVYSADGDKFIESFEKVGKGVYLSKISLKSEGLYKVIAVNQKGMQSEMSLFCRKDCYSDYIKAARKAALIYEQKTNSNAEAWYGLFSAMIAREYFPDDFLDNELDKVFWRINSFTLINGINLPSNNPMRIQDTSLKAALFAQYYRATGNLKYLRMAADLADFIMTKQIPDKWDYMVGGYGEIDGAYRCGNSHYTSVIYVAKGLMEVMREERKLLDADKTGEWKHRYDRHYASVKMAIDDLARKLDNIHTEGEMTFEDGMISCSYTQLSEFALLQPEDSEERLYYTEAAEKMANMHRCLSQIIIPDARMNGGSLRFWEAQYDILTMPNMMNSPHGWSAWRIYGLRNLYLLTGKYDYLRQMINSIGSCIQLINPETAELNWAFVQDPYLKVQRFVPDSDNPGKGKHVEQVIGEQYMSMISDWYKADTTKMVSSFGRYDGGCCDNDVHEVFKCLGEILLTSAYVYEDEKGKFICHNCDFSVKNGSLVITPKENCIDKIHFNILRPKEVNINVCGDLKKFCITKKEWIYFRN